MVEGGYSARSGLAQFSLRKDIKIPFALDNAGVGAIKCAYSCIFK